MVIAAGSAELYCFFLCFSAEDPLNAPVSTRQGTGRNFATQRAANEGVVAVTWTEGQTRESDGEGGRDGGARAPEAVGRKSKGTGRRLADRKARGRELLFHLLFFADGLTALFGLYARRHERRQVRERGPLALTASGRRRSRTSSGRGSLENKMNNDNTT